MCSVLKTCRLYNVFGSGSNHAKYAQFIAQTSAANNVHKIGLLQGAGTRMASWFYDMIRLLRLKQPLKATIHQQQFRDLVLNVSDDQGNNDDEEDNCVSSISQDKEEDGGVRTKFQRTLETIRNANRSNG